MKRKQVFKLISATIGILHGLLLAEVGYRFFHFIAYRDLKDIATGNRPPVTSPDEEKTLGQIVQLSANNKIIYELIPSSSYRFQNALVQINAQGFRDAAYPALKAKGRIRIIGLGDSVMFGWGVEEGESYLTKLENSLNEQDSIAYEIINTAVPGYNTVMEIATLEHKIALKDVDMVIINYIGNDCDLPNFIRKKPDYFGLKKSFILQRFEDNDGMDKNLKSAPFNKQGTNYAHTPDSVPAEYRDMVDIDAYIAAMKRLRVLQEMYEFKVITLATNPDAPAIDYVTLACKMFGFELIDIYPIWQNHKAANPNDNWRLSKKDGHPSVLGHEVIAGILKQRIRQSF